MIFRCPWKFKFKLLYFCVKHISCYYITFLAKPTITIFIIFNCIIYILILYFIISSQCTYHIGSIRVGVWPIPVGHRHLLLMNSLGELGDGELMKLVILDLKGIKILKKITQYSPLCFKNREEKKLVNSNSSYIGTKNKSVIYCLEFGFKYFLGIEWCNNLNKRFMIMYILIELYKEFLLSGIFVSYIFSYMIPKYISKMRNLLEIVTEEKCDILNLLVSFWFIRKCNHFTRWISRNVLQK